VEIKPQALEWFFSRACSYRFQVSLDNLAMVDPEAVDVAAFQRSVLHQASSWQQNGLPERAELFFEALCREFATEVPALELQFSLAELVT
jgi:elongation factor P hydroxylase